MERTIREFTLEDKAAFIAAARTLLTANNGSAVKFRHQGRTIKGIDCIGTVVWSLREMGIEVTMDRIDYGKLPAKRKLADALVSAFGDPVMVHVKDITDLQPGDVVAMQWGSEEGHVGIIVDHPEGVGILHAYADKGRVIETRVDELIARNIYGVYRP